ncbi:MAG: FAD:protein FMN transferase [Bacteroidia bacterium]|nr:FAD:protein FMN transferase [Bacteroidia bacterium]
MVLDYMPVLNWPFIKRLFLVILFTFGVTYSQNTPSYEQKAVKLMGSAFIFKAIHEDQSLCIESIDKAIKEVRRIEALISSWQANSQTSKVNRMAGRGPVKVDWELFQLIHRSLKVSSVSRGSFDISFASADRIWKFDGSMTSLPDSESVAESVRNIGYENILLNFKDTTVTLTKEGMKIGFGAIGKGYAANRAKAVMTELGIKNGLVNAGGDLICWGKDIDGNDFHVGIADPHDKSNMLAWLVINDLSVVTSGDYERYTHIDGNRYAHIINPKTGYPVQGVASVSIFCPDAELADALATAVFVMGPADGIKFIERLRGIEGIIVDDEGEMFTSKGLELQYYAEKKPEAKPLKKIGLKDEKN